MAQLRADIGLAARRVASSGLGHHGLSPNTSEVIGELCETPWVVHTIEIAFSCGATRTVEILVHFVDELVCRAILVADSRQVGR